MKLLIKSFTIALVINFLSTQLPIRGLEVFSASECGFPVGLPFAYMWTTRFLPPNTITCMMTPPFPISAYLADLFFWFVVVLVTFKLLGRFSFFGKTR